MSVRETDLQKRDQAVLNAIIEVYQKRIEEGELDVFLCATEIRKMKILDFDDETEMSEGSIRTCVDRLETRMMLICKYTGTSFGKGGRKTRFYKPSQAAIAKKNATERAFTVRPSDCYLRPVVSYKVDPEMLSPTTIADFERFFGGDRESALREAGLSK